MLVLDYPRTMKADDRSLLIPPFHTGHLGCRPSTEVTLQLVKAPSKSTAFCELIVSSFPRSGSGTAILTAVMRDSRGVVGRLVSALAELGINIYAEESASIAYLDRHSVSLTLNLDAFGKKPRGANPLLPGLYRDYAAYVPLHDPRCRLIFETVMRRCVDVLALRPGGPEPTLDLSIRLLDVTEPDWPGTAVLVADSKQTVKLPLPENIRRAIEMEHGATEDPDVDYIFLSDTDDRTLRAFFLPPGVAARLYHVAVHHRDRSRALETLLALTAKAEFNILTSLVGPGETHGENVWEAVLEYQGGDVSQPARPATSDPAWFDHTALPWLRDKLAAAVDAPAFVSTFGFSLSTPTYPRPQTPVQRLSLLPDDAAAVVGVGPPTRKLEPVAEIQLRRRAISSLPADEQELRYSILERIGRRRVWPTIFLAFTEDGKAQADMIKGRLSEHYDVIDRNADRDPESPERAIEIASCDHFIGLWHHDKRAPQGPGTFGGSPWVHYQRGVAIASGKPTLMVCSADADPRFWPGPPGPNHIVYWDLEFSSQTLGEIEKYCREHFVRD